jgi:hypothetical protein
VTVGEYDGWPGSSYGLARRLRIVHFRGVLDGKLGLLVVTLCFGICVFLVEKLTHASSPRFPSVVTIPIFEVEFFPGTAR